MPLTRSKTAASRAVVQSLLNEVVRRERNLSKIEKETKKLEKRAKAEQKALNEATKRAKAVKAKADREARKKINAALSPRVTRRKAKSGGCGCGCGGSKM